MADPTLIYTDASGTQKTFATAAGVIEAVTSLSGKFPASLGPKSGALSLSFAPATDAVFNLGTLNGAATLVAQNTGNTALAGILTAVTDNSPAAVIQSGTWQVNLGTIAGVATEVTIAALNTKTPTQGQKVKGGSVPVTLASDHDPIDTVIKATAASRSTSAGVAATVLMPLNAARRGFSVQNQHATAKIYINGSGTAVVADGSSLMIGPGQYFESNPTHSGGGAISIISDTAATPVYAREW